MAKEGQKMRERRNQMHAEDPACHWCGIKTELPPLEAHARVEGWHATIDHLFERGHPLRLSETPGIRRYVLSCARCNEARGRAAQGKWDDRQVVAPQFGIWSIEWLRASANWIAQVPVRVGDGCD